MDEAKKEGERWATLQKSELRFRTICEHAPMMIDEFDENGRCVLYNRACETHLGYTQEEVNASGDALALCYPDPAARALVIASIQRADNIFREYRVRAKDGSYRQQMWADLRLPDGSNIAVGHDVTEQRMVEEQLRRSQKVEALGQFAAGMAHDFNNLLTVVLANAELIKEDRGFSPEVSTSLSEIVSATERGAALIRKLLAFTDRDVLTLESVDLNHLAGELADTVTRLLPETIRVRVDTQPSLPPVRADAGAIEQMMLNLVTNARDAMPGGGQLVLRLEERWVRAEESKVLNCPEGGYVALSVHDDGRGMDETTLKYAVEPFFTTKRETGTGLGLAMVHSLMLQHGGAAQIQSEAGVGTTVTLLFPIRSRVDEKVRPEGPARPRILVVEDEPSIRKVTCRTLVRSGYDVEAASDGVRAMHQLEQGPPFDLVVTDLVMPNMGGAELYTEAQQLPNVPEFIFVTGYAPDEARELIAGLDEPTLVRKPYRMHDLIAAIAQRVRPAAIADDPPAS